MGVFRHAAEGSLRMARAIHTPRLVETARYYLLTTPYDPALVRALQRIPAGRFERPSKTWRLPKSVAAQRVLAEVAARYGITRTVGDEPGATSVQLALPLGGEPHRAGVLP